MNNPPSILIVDDDIGTRRTLEMILAKKNYQPVTAPDGAAALALAQESFFNLALLDICLPDISGTDLLVQLKARHPDLEVLIITGHATLESAVQALANGAYQYFIKPINVDELLIALDQALHKQRLTIENRQLLQVVQKELEERKRVEEALRESEERYRLLFDNSGVGIGYYSPEGRVIVWNKVALANLGVQPEDVTGKTLLELFGAEAGAEYTERVLRAARTQLPQIYEGPIHLPSGDKWFRSIYNQVTNAQGVVVGVQVVSDDITERKRAEDALEKEHALLRTLIDHLPDRIYVKDTAGRFLLNNPAHLKALGAKSQEDALGKTDFDFRPKERAEKSAAGDRQVLESGNALINHEESSVLPDGTQRWTLVTKVPLRDKEGNVIGLVGISRDITERKQRERELQAVAAVSAALRVASSREEMLPIVLDQTQQFLHADALSINTLDPHTGETVIELARGVWAAATGTRIPAHQGVGGRVLETGQPYVTNDLQNDALFYWKELIGNLRGFAAVPLMVQERAVGLLSIGRITPIAPEEVRVLTAIADIVANALHRAALHERTEHQVQYLRALHTIDRTISASLDLRFTLNILIDQVVTQLRVDAADVLLYNPVLQTLNYAAGYGFRTKGKERHSCRLGEEYAGIVALERRIVQVHNLRQSSAGGKLAPALMGEGFVFYCGVPLIAKGTIKGVLEVFQRTPLRAEMEWLDFFEMLAEQAAIAIDNAQLFEELQRAHSDLVLSYDATIEGWSRALDLRDQETEGHAQRVAELTEQLARAVGVSEADLIYIRWGALLHDIGKIGVPDHILWKSAALTEEEWAIMRRHPEFARDVLQPIPFLRAALDIPYCHHERWDGTGYPRGLQGTAIPLSARIFALADTWDALRSARPYRAAWTDEQARTYIREQAGKWFDPTLVERFLKVVR